MLGEGLLYKLFLFSPVDDENKMINAFKNGFFNLTNDINIINHNIEINISKNCKVAAITINKRLNKNVTEFFNNQIELIYNHFYKVKTDKLDIKMNLLDNIKLFNCMYDIEFIAGTEEMAAKVIGCFFNTCWYSNGLLLNSDGSKFVNKNNKLIMDDSGNSDLEFCEVMS